MIQIIKRVKENFYTFIKRVESYPVVYFGIYWGLLSIAICYVVFALALLITPKALDTLPGVIYYIHDTQPKLISYMLLVPIIFIWWGVFVFLLNWRKTRIFLKNIYSYIGVFSLQLLWGICSLVICFQIKSFLGRLCCLLLFFFPVGVILKKSLKVLFWILLIGAVGLFCKIFGGFVFNPLLVANEYMGISSQTKWKDDTLINEKELLDSIIYERQLYADNQYCVKVQKMPEEIKKEDFLKESTINYYLYSSGPSTLCLAAAIPLQFKLTLRSMLTPSEYKQVEQYSAELEERHLETIFNLNQNKDFIQKNSYQYRWQILSRGFLHHHNHFFGAAYQYAIGRPVNEIFMQYGALHTMGVGYLLKSLNRLDYANYIHFYYTLYFVYFACFLGVAWFLFKDRTYLLLTAILPLCGWLGQTYQHLYLGPGTNPARYMMYLGVVLSLFYYINKNKFIYFYLAVLCNLLAIAINLHFGAFAVASFLGVLVVKMLLEKKLPPKKEVVGAFIFLIASVVTFLVVNIGPNPVNGYFFSGLLAFPFRNSVIIWVFLYVALCYMLVFYNWRKQKELVVVLLFLTFFSQGVFLYYLRSAVIYLLAPVSSIFVLQGLTALRVLFQMFPDKYRNIQKNFMGLLVLLSIVWALALTGRFNKKSKSQQQYFAQNQLYKWELPGTGFYSPMNPKEFMPTIELINKYKGYNGIYLLSHMDNFLPMLSKTYNRLPFIDLQWYLTTAYDYDVVLTTLQRDKPDFLFVDADIAYPHRLQVLPTDYPILGKYHQESLWRAERMELLNKLFHAVLPNYELLESTALISVYKKKEREWE